MRVREYGVPRYMGRHGWPGPLALSLSSHEGSDDGCCAIGGGKSKKLKIKNQWPALHRADHNASTNASTSIAKNEAQSGGAQGIATAAQVVVLWTVPNGRDCLKLDR